MGVNQDGEQNQKTRLRKAEDFFEDRIVAIWTNLQTNHLWQRMLKNTIATTITVILALIPAIVRVYGRAVYLAPITTVFGHPGRRFGMMAEALVLALTGTLVGTAWSSLGIYLSSLVFNTNAAAAYTVKGVFLAIALLFHGFLRSHTPRLFIFVLLHIIVSVVSLTGVATAVSSTLVTTLLYPILTAVGVLLLVNVLVFPEFSSSFLGITTIETLTDTTNALRDAGIYFSASLESLESEQQAHVNAQCHDSSSKEPPQKDQDVGQEPSKAGESKENSRGAEESFFRRVWKRIRPKPAKEQDDGIEQPMALKVKLSALTAAKAKLRAKLGSCKAAQTECNFELAYAVLPPRDLKPVSDTAMKKLVANTIALIGACESKYALMGDDSDTTRSEEVATQLRMDAEQANVDIDAKATDQRDGSEDDTSNDEKNIKKRKGRSKSRGRRRSLWADIVDRSSGDEKEGDEKGSKHRRKSRSKTKVEEELQDIELVKPRKEIEFGDVDLLMFLVKSITKSSCELQAKIDESVNAITSCLAFCYDVDKLPSGARPPKGIKLEELDIRIEIISAAIVNFDVNSAAALQGAAALRDIEATQHDIMPRMETFLVSSFLLNLRQAALHTKDMLIHSRELVEKRQNRHERRRIYFPRIKWRKWLISGGEMDEFSLPEQGRKDARSGNAKDLDLDTSRTTSNENLVKQNTDEESGLSPRATHTSVPLRTNGDANPRKNYQSGAVRLRNSLADFVEYLVASEDVLYAIKLTIAVFLVTWPALIAKWNTWYSLNRGLWAALQLVLITEVAIGTSVMTFLLRAAGTSLGCLWGYAAYTARDGNPYVVVVLLVIGIIPSTYVQLGSKYIKAGMVSIISMCIVALATEVQTVPGSATENFLKRFIAFLIGGVVALVVEVVIFPVRARDRLVESLASAINQISDMEACLAYGIETEVNVDVQSSKVSERFDSAKAKAQGALTAAETFLPFCAQEPRLKGSFKSLALVYAEILYVLHQIVDKMDNMLQLRKEYGSGVLEELNTQVYAYRRNVAGSITLVLFAVHEALTTKLPLPQFLPSARLAHLRMVNRVREVVLSGTGAVGQGSKPEGDEIQTSARRSELELNLVKRIVRHKFLSWNAASAGQIEVIEYLEELVDLTKLLVGANEFKSGLLTRPTYRQYVERIGSQQTEVTGDAQEDDTRRDSNLEREKEEMRDTVPETTSRPPPVRLGLSKRTKTGQRMEENRERPLQRLRSSGSGTQEKDEDLPMSLQRVRSRRLEQARSQEEESWASGREGRRVRWEK